ncbi:MAG TPA: terminase family protein [Candidatus Solibacter sp.]|nr:terminase family protein [Candidatus Solibacter sp.]
MDQSIGEERRVGTSKRVGISYDPLPSQKRFHECEKRFKGFSGPIGSGKSQALCQEAIRLSYQNPGRLGLIGAPTYPMLRDATQVALLRILQENDIAYEHSKAENTLIFKDTGSRILFRPVEEFERLRGTNLAWFGLDELTYTQEEAWLRLEGRLRDPLAKRLCGFAVWTPKGFDWVYRRFISNPAPGYEAILARAFENRHLLAKVSDFYERLKESYDEKFYAQEVLGDYLSMDGGRVYSAFQRAEHTCETKVDPQLPLRWALDFNVDPMSSVIVQITRNMITVLDEIYLRNASTKDACEEFVRRFPRHDRGVVVYGDSSGNQRQTTGWTDYQIIQEYFAANSALRPRLNQNTSNPRVRDRINLVNRQFRTAAGTIGMIVDPKCKELIRDLEEVTYKAETGDIDKHRDRLRTHLSDALGYLVCQECSGKRVAGPQDKRLIG